MGGLPVEEFLPTLMSGVGALWIAIGARARGRATRDADRASARERNGQR
jgi:hypothetical protein